MYTNMIRKGAAIASGLALASAGLIAAPAQATATGLLWSPQGQVDELVGVEGDKFALQFANPSGAITTHTTDAATTNGLTAAKVTVEWVPVGGKTAPTITKSVDATSGFAYGAAASNELKVVIGVDNDNTSSGGNQTPDGVIALTGPSGLDYDAQFTVMVTYNDGSTSEVETVTFKEETSVTAALGVTPVSVGTVTVSGTFSLSGINTQNWVKSNADAIQATSDSSDVGLILTNDTTALTGGSVSYSSVTDTYTISKASVAVAQSTSVSMAATFNSVEINKHFDSAKTAADAASATFTLEASDANAALEIAVQNTGAVHNDTATATSFVPAETVYAPEGTKTLNFVVSALTGTTTPKTAAGADIPITITLSDAVSPVNDLGTTTISSNGKTLDVTGTSTSFTLTTNSSGQVAFTITADNAVAGESFHIDAANSIGDSIDRTLVEWQEAAMTALPSVDGNFTIAPGDSLSLDYTVVDQFGNAADGDYQLVFTRARTSGDRDTAAEYANWSYVAPVSADGTASVTIVDNGAAGVEGVDTVTATVQQKASSGTGYVAATGATNDTFTLTYENDLASKTAITLANYDGIANAAGTALEPLKLETTTLTNYDSRIGGDKPEFDTNGASTDGNVPTSNVGVTPVTYGSDMLRVYGQVKTPAGVGIEGVSVRLSGTGVNFANNKAEASATKMQNDSFVVFTDASGSYEAFVRSTVAGTQTISVDAQGTTDSIDVRFQNSTGVADSLSLDVGGSVSPGARADITATVVDAQGKPVPSVTVNFKDNGPGVLNASSATTDIFGEAQVTLTTLTTESGTTTITAYATIAGANQVVTGTINVGVSSSSPDAKVNAGSFKGYVAVYARGYEGQRLSAKIGNDWVIVDPIVNNQEKGSLFRTTDFTGAGVDIAVRIYIDRVLMDTINLTTK